MTYIGDFRLGDTVDFKFTTRQATGAPTTLAGTPAVSAYPGNSTTEITAGITLSVDFDSRTGLNNVRIVATSGNGYATATNYAVVITAGTVNSVSVVGEVVGHFSIENRSALMPTTAARTLDVSAGGEAGVDWANIGSPTTAQNLSGTTVKTATDVEADTQDIQARLPAALTAGGNMKADALAFSGDTVAADNAESFFDGTGYAGANNVIPTVTTVTNLTNAPTSGDFTATMKTSIGTAVAASAVASVTGNVGGNVNGSVASVVGNVGGNVAGSVGSVTAGVTVTTNNDKTGYALTAAYDYAKGTVAMTESYAANGVAPTPIQAQYAIHQMLMQFAIGGTSYTVKKLDNSTTAFVVTLDDATNPTSAVRT